jgi:transcriptional regulator with XRE-family HTH domain
MSTAVRSKNSELVFRPVNDFRVAIRALRQYVGLTMEQAAHEVKVPHPTYLSRIETGEILRHINRGIEMLEALGGKVYVQFPEGGPVERVGKKRGPKGPWKNHLTTAKPGTKKPRKKVA